MTLLRVIIALSVGAIAGAVTAIGFAIIYAIADLYLSGHSIEVNNPEIAFGFVTTTAVDLAFVATTVAAGLLASWLYFKYGAWPARKSLSE